MTAKVSSDMAIAQLVLDEQLQNACSALDVIPFDQAPDLCRTSELYSKFGPARALKFLQVDERIEACRAATKAAALQLQSQLAAPDLSKDNATYLFGVGRCSEFGSHAAARMRQMGVKSDIAALWCRNPVDQNKAHFLLIFGRGIEKTIEQRKTNEVVTVLKTVPEAGVIDRLLQKKVNSVAAYVNSSAFGYFTLRGITQITRVDFFPNDIKVATGVLQEGRKVHQLAQTLLPTIAKIMPSIIPKTHAATCATILQGHIPGSKWQYIDYYAVASSTPQGSKIWYDESEVRASSVASYLKAYGIAFTRNITQAKSKSTITIENPDVMKIANAPAYDKYLSKAGETIAEVTSAHVGGTRPVQLIAAYL